jgi:hypothetical protein
MKKKQTQSANVAGASFQPIPTLQETTNTFISGQPKSRRSEGKNENLKDFLKIAAMITQNYPSFDQNTVLQLSRSLDLDASEVITLFHDWAGQLVRDGRCRKVSGCYSWDTYHFIWNSMDNHNQYNPADNGKPFNFSVKFSESQHEVTQDEREAALDRIQELIDHTKTTITEHE